MYLFFLMYALAMAGLDKCIVFFRLSFMLEKHMYDWTNYENGKKHFILLLEVLWNSFGIYT